MRRVTFSRNLTLSLSRTCRCYCKYCAFATHQAHIHPPEEVIERLDRAARRNVKELLVLTGERPEVNPVVAERLRSWGHEDFTSYVEWACERGAGAGDAAPHEHRRGGARGLRPAAVGHGLSGTDAGVDQRAAHGDRARGLADQAPAGQARAIETAGELRIPFTSGILVGIGETEEERVASLEALAAVQERHGHIQEVILQNFVPHPRYYGAEVADIAEEASERRWAEGDRPRARAVSAMPAWASPVSLDDMKRLVAECRRVMPDVGIQVPPNLSDWWVDLVEAGATDLGGLSANGDHISPEHPFPSPLQVRKRLRPLGYALTERLCVYPQYMNSDWMEAPVLGSLAERFPTFMPRRESRARATATATAPAPAVGNGDLTSAGGGAGQRRP